MLHIVPSWGRDRRLENVGDLERFQASGGCSHNLLARLFQ